MNLHAALRRGHSLFTVNSKRSFNVPETARQASLGMLGAVESAHHSVLATSGSFDDGERT